MSQSDQVDPEKIGLKITSFDLISTKLTANEVKWIVSSALRIFKN